MKARFLMVPVAALGMWQSANATVYMSIEEAQTLMFPGATFTPEPRILTDAQVSAIEKASETRVVDKRLRAWRVSSGGWFIADEVVGKHEFIPFALALDQEGRVKDIEIIEYREAYGGDIRDPKWRAQFVAKTSTSTMHVTKDIQNISGATLSSKHLTDGIRRLLFTYSLVLADK